MRSNPFATTEADPTANVIPWRTSPILRPKKMSKNQCFPGGRYRSVLFFLTVFTTLWAGAYQAYSGTIRGPGNFLWEHPDMLWNGIPFAGTPLVYPRDA